MNTDNKAGIKALVNGAYSIQRLRVATGNRLCAAFRQKLGLDSSEKEKAKKEAGEVLDRIRESYRKLTDGVKKDLPDKRTFVGDSTITDYTELCLVHQYMTMEADEIRHMAKVKQIVPDHPIWGAFCAGVPGCGELLCAALISIIDIEVSKYPSSLRQLAGYGVERDGKGTSKRKEHMHSIAYKDKDDNDCVRMGIKHNPWLKTKMYLLGTCMLKAGLRWVPLDDETDELVDPADVQVRKKKIDGVVSEIPCKRMTDHKYCRIYLDARNRCDNHPEKKEWTDGHKHMHALRVMNKQFLADLYVAWRTLEGLEVSVPYAEGKLGIVHGKAA